MKPLVIGITGGIGGGKTTFAHLLRDAGELVYDTDKEAKIMQDENPAVKIEIQNLFGEEIYTESGLNRKKIASIVFNDKEKLAQLNQIIHPRVKEDFRKWILNNSTRDFLFMECAVLFEGNFNKLVDKVLLITAPEEVRIARVIKRDKLSEEAVKSRINNQLSEVEKIKHSDWVIDTNKGISPKENIEQFLEMLKNETGKI